jgi:hypothetical protein
MSVLIFMISLLTSPCTRARLALALGLGLGLSLGLGLARRGSAPCGRASPSGEALGAVGRGGGRVGGRAGGRFEGRGRAWFLTK